MRYVRMTLRPLTLVMLLGCNHQQRPAPVIGQLDELCPAAVAWSTAGVPIHSVRVRVIGITLAGKRELLRTADVELPAGSRGTLTSAAGEVTFTGVQSGTHELRVRAIGYRPARATFGVYDLSGVEVVVRLIQDGLILYEVGHAECVIRDSGVPRK
jgi:hypothetical protein